MSTSINTSPSGRGSLNEGIGQSKQSLVLLTLGALGVVYGDIGTSPLYALRECFHGAHAIELTQSTLFGVLSLIIWGLILVVSVKYLTVVMRADNKGEGGILALMAFALKSIGENLKISRGLIIYIGLFGSALIYGDGVITPAISVLSAVEGLKIATPLFDPFVIPITLAILYLLFAVQRGGTARIGAFFGPIILLWFFTLAVLGIGQIIGTPRIFLAFNPFYGVDFLLHHGTQGFYTLGAVFLAFTGAEALYADMGHFGRRPIRFGWFCVAFPCLVLNYLGQGALLLNDPAAVEHPFYRLAPGWALLPLVALSTMATVIASQALISGAFSLTSQAVQLGYLPRMLIQHTSSKEAGQIYIPSINWLLYLSTSLVVLMFRSSGALASAYGIAVVMTMIITTVLLYFVAKNRWHWSPLLLILVIGTFLIIDAAFLFANAAKILDGGWFPILFALGLFTLMTTWWRGRQILWTQLREQMVPLREFIQGFEDEEYAHIKGTAVFLIRDLVVTPPALLYNLRYNKVLHERIIFLTFVTEEVPYLGAERERVEIIKLSVGFYRIIVHHGFMEKVDVPSVLTCDCGELFPSGLKDVCFFVDRVIPVPTSLPGMAIWRESLFAFMMQNSLRATKFYEVPARQVIEIGFQIEI